MSSSARGFAGDPSRRKGFETLRIRRPWDARLRQDTRGLAARLRSFHFGMLRLMKTIIFLPTQGPHLPRTGPVAAYDWRVQCQLAAARWKSGTDSVIYVPSAFQQTGARSELDFYGELLSASGVPGDAMMLDPRGLDTVEQCELALALAARENARLVAISCHVHLPRVRYLLRGHGVEHVVASGTPNRWLHFTHIILAVLFPILDMLGLRGWWKSRVTKRRQAGLQ